MQKAAIDFKTFIFVLVVLLLLVVLNGQNFLQGPKDLALSLLSPITDRFQYSSNGLGDFINTIQKIDKFKSENEKLQDENQKLNFALAGKKEIQLENETLKKQLKFKEDLCAGSDCINFEMGSITGRGLDNYGKYIIINLGKEAGATIGQAITVGGGAMIGKIVEVDAKYSKVMLLTSPESSINCISQTTRANGLLRGKYGTGARLEMIDQSEDLAEGDIIISSGLEPGIPKGLILGKVAKIEQSPNLVFKSADVELAADVSHIEEVFLVK